jgi:hypothetical protein
MIYNYTYSPCSVVYNTRILRDEIYLDNTVQGIYYLRPEFSDN